VLVAGAVCGVHAAAGCGDAVEFDGHAFELFGGVTQTVLTDNMKTVVVDRIDGQPCFHAKMLDFASYYGFIPQACRPYRPETEGKIESTNRFIKGNFWPGIEFGSLAELNGQALDWCGESMAASMRPRARSRRRAFPTKA